MLALYNGASMPLPPRLTPADVIPLSPFRAELGRGRRLRRADALLAERDVDAAVRALPGDELYYVVHELGLEDATPLLGAATAEQLQIVLDFALWERDRIVPDALADWLEAMAHASPERIASWLAGLDAELVALILRRGARIYDLTQGPPPEEPEGTFFPTPDGFFLLDVVGIPRDPDQPAADADEDDRAAVIIRLVDSLYRVDKDLARRLLVASIGEMDSELEEAAYRWQRGRMSDLGFADYYEALEVYREIDLAGVRIGEGKPTRLRATVETGANADALRVPTALAQRLGDVGGSPFARAAQKLAAGDEIEELRFALVALTNQVLAADRVSPGDDDAVAAVLQRLAATLDLAIERLAPGDDERGAAALRSIPLVRLFRTGVTLIGKVRRLARALTHGGPFGRRGLALAETDDAPVLEAITRARPLYPRLLDEPPGAGDRPFQSLADLARAGAAVERAAAAQAMLHGLGVTPRDIAPDGPLLAATGVDVAALDAGLLARTVLVRVLLAGDGGRPSIAALEPREVHAFEARLRHGEPGPAKLPDALATRARALLTAAAPPALSAAAAAVADRWIASLAPLEPVLVRKPEMVTRAPAPRTRAPEPTRKDAAAKRRPKPSIKKPAGSNKKPAGSNKKPALAKRKPALAKKKPALAKKKPALAKKKPAPSKRKSGKRPPRSRR
jgi:hypothetical protein